MSHIDWTQVLLALVTMLGTVLTGVFANRANRSAVSASAHADAARVASLRPVSPDATVTPVDGSASMRKARVVE